MKTLFNLSFPRTLASGEVEFTDENDVQCLDVFLPEEPDEKPNGACLFLVHGGGWTGGGRRQWHAVGQHFCKLGYVCVSAGYRLAPEHRFPKQFEDVRAAYALTKSLADQWNFDPRKMAAMGSSAGGHLVAMLATTADDDSLGTSPGLPTTQTRPQAIAALCPVFSVMPGTRMPVPESVAKLLGGPAEEHLEAAKAASPAEHVTSQTPSFIIINGDADDVTPLAHQHDMVEVLRAHGVHSELVVLPSVGHGYGYGVTTDAQKQMLVHVERYLKAQLL